METKRFKSKEFSLTYPRCSISTELYLQTITIKFDTKISYCAVVQEKHKDGAFHLHAQIQFIREFSANSKSFDIALGQQIHHCNIQKTKSSEDWKKYLEKEGTVVSWGQYQNISVPRVKKQTDSEKPSNKELLEGDLESMIQTDRISLLSLPSILAARKAYETIKVSTKLRPKGYFPPTWQEKDVMSIMMRVFNKNHKKKHYWLYSDMPNKGKTTFLLRVSEIYECAWYNTQEKYQNFNQSSSVLIFDEFGKGNSVKITDLNAMCDGNYQYPSKGRPAITLNCPIVIICSNFSIPEVYPHSLERIEARFNQICLNNLIFI